MAAMKFPGTGTRAVIFRFPAFHRQYALFCGDRDFIGREARHGQRDLVAVFAQALDVAR
jgi:hypothetical protein